MDRSDRRRRESSRFDVAGRQVIQALAVVLSMACLGGFVLSVPPEIVTEQVVAAAVATAGSANAVRSIERAAGLPDSGLARSLALAILETNRGRPDRAQRVIYQALRRLDPDADSGLVASLLSLWLDNGIGRDERVFLVGAGEDPAGLFPLARALDLAQTDRCEEGIEILERVRSNVPAQPAPLLLEARSWELCGRPSEALLALSRIGDRANEGSVDVRVSVQVGKLLLSQGDADSAALWCAAAASNSRSLPRVHHQAAACLAAANAARGVLPHARDQFIIARKAALFDPALSPRERILAGKQAVWVAVRSRRASWASEALEMLNRLDILSPDAGDRREFGHLRVIALVELERQIEAVAELRRLGNAPADEVGQILANLARSRIRQGEGDPVAASTRLGEAVKMARRHDLGYLLAAAEMDRAHLARWEGRRPLAQRYAVTALESWPRRGATHHRHDYVDPIFMRRAMQFAIEQGRLSGPLSGSRAGKLLSLAENLRAFAEQRSLAEIDLPDAARVRRSLAARNSGLLYYMIGETRSYAWLVEPGGMRVAELPAGQELFRKLFPSDRAGAEPVTPEVLRNETAQTLLGGLLDAYPEDRGLIICPDAFLIGVPWTQVESPQRRRLQDSYTISVISSLASVVDPLGARLSVGQSHTGFLSVIASNPDSGLARGVVSEANLPFEPLTSIEATGDDLHEIVRQYAAGQAVVHLSAPLEAAGLGEEGITFSLPGGGRGELGRTFNLADLFRPDLHCDLIVLSPQDGWSRAPASRVRAAFRAASGGARAVVVPLDTLRAGTAAEFWPRFYAALGQGESKGGAVASVTSDLPAGILPAFQVVGHADTLVVDPQGEQWPFWASLGGGLLIILLTVIRAVWRRRDPFDQEPPEE